MTAGSAGAETLQEASDRLGSPVELLRNSPARPTVFPVTPEFSNWRSEQRSWRISCALLDQSHHLTDLFLRGPGAETLLRGLAVNSFAKFPADRAKQFIAVNHNGQLIGDAILAQREEDLPKARDALYQVAPAPFVQFARESYRAG